MRRLREYIEDYIANSPLLEMATERKVIVAKARSLNMEIATHIIKVLTYPTNDARTHWEVEINAWVNAIARMKYDRNRRLTSEQYFKLLWEEPFEHTDMVSEMHRVFPKWGLPKPNADVMRIEVAIKKIYKQLCDMLEKGEPIAIQELI